MLPQHGTLSISRSRLRHNLALVRERIGPHPELCAIIKANAYGHGVEPIASLLAEAGTRWVCVYGLQEAAPLARNCGFKILILSPLVLADSSCDYLRSTLDWCGLSQGDLPIRLTLTDLQSARHLSRAVASFHAHLTVPVHIQVDAGLTRMGIAPAHAPELAAEIASLPGLRLEGLFAHFSHGDVPGHPTLAQQRSTLLSVAHTLRTRHPDLIVHLQNSGGAWNVPSHELAMVRLGIVLYGLQPSTSDPIPGLLPIGEVTAPILTIHDCPAGTGVGYGHTFTTARPSRLAIVPVGYADGYPRHLSNRALCQVQRSGSVEQAPAPVVGRVSMDQIIVDITDLPWARVGDTVIVISRDPAQPHCLDRMADALGTIGYELATHLGSRLKRVIVD